MAVDIDDIESLLVQDTHENAYAGFCGQKEKYGVVSFMFQGKKSLTSVAQKKDKEGPQIPLWTLEVSCKGIMDLGLSHGGDWIHHQPFVSGKLSVNVLSIPRKKTFHEEVT